MNEKSILQVYEGTLTYLMKRLSICVCVHFVKKQDLENLAMFQLDKCIVLSVILKKSDKI